VQCGEKQRFVGDVGRFEIDLDCPERGETAAEKHAAGSADGGAGDAAGLEHEFEISEQRADRGVKGFQCGKEWGLLLAPRAGGSRSGRTGSGVGNEGDDGGALAHDSA
jgi:hypothetical protein